MGDRIAVDRAEAGTAVAAGTAVVAEADRHIAGAAGRIGAVARTEAVAHIVAAVVERTAVAAREAHTAAEVAMRVRRVSGRVAVGDSRLFHLNRTFCVPFGDRRGDSHES